MAQKRSVIIDVDAKGLPHHKAHTRIGRDGYFATPTVDEEKSSPKPGLVSLVAEPEKAAPVLEPIVEVPPASATVVEVIPAPEEPIAEEQLMTQTADSEQFLSEPVTAEKKSKKGKKSELVSTSS